MAKHEYAPCSEKCEHSSAHCSECGKPASDVIHMCGKALHTAAIANMALCILHPAHDGLHQDSGRTANGEKYTIAWSAV